MENQLMHTDLRTPVPGLKSLLDGWLGNLDEFRTWCKIVLFSIFCITLLTAHTFARDCKDILLAQKSKIDQTLGGLSGSTLPCNDSTKIPDPKTLKIPPHAHKRCIGQKYAGVTDSELKAEAKQKAAEFKKFFKDEYQGPETTMEFWSNLKIDSPEKFNEALEHHKILRDQGYEVDGFIFIIDLDETLRVAPRLMKTGKDTGKAKHTALSNASEVRASGEFQVATEGRKMKLHYNLKSGTYLAALDPPVQVEVCYQLGEDFRKLTGLSKDNIEFLEDF